MAFFVDHLLVADGGESYGVPIDHAHTAVDEPFAVEVDEDADDAFVARVVHSEGGAVPVARGTEPTQLLEYDAAVLLFPLPSVFHELIAGEAALIDAAVGQHLDHLGLGGYRGVVSAWHPASVLPLHTGAADEDILDGVVEHVAHVEHTSDVGRWDDHGVGDALVGLGVEELLVKPKLIPFLLDFARAVFGCDFHSDWYCVLIFLKKDGGASRG